MTQTVAVVGLGYVGLPLAVEFGKHRPPMGSVFPGARFSAYGEQRDATGGVTLEQFGASRYVQFTADPTRLRVADVIIVAVPTPIDNVRLPDFGPLLSASRTVG